MTTWISTESQPPAAKGRYWTRTDLKIWTDAQGVRHTNYRQDWIYFDGSEWIGGSPDFWYGQREAVKDAV